MCSLLVLSLGLKCELKGVPLNKIRALSSLGKESAINLLREWISFSPVTPL